ncbi:MAG TPA: MGMT family protein, partial [Deltaproteobacteria bacterium]|nr:MGMT family protein [Deltaproteobacteria bacterium]
RSLEAFPGGLGFEGQRPVWFKTAPAVRPESFTQKAYTAMCAIRYGQTVSYAGLGRMLGNRFLARAVGNVCASNPVPIVVPCHRVVGARSLGGYTPGLDKKRWLMALENPFLAER